MDGFVGVDGAVVVFGAGAGASEGAVAGTAVLGVLGLGALGVLLDSARLESVR